MSTPPDRSWLPSPAEPDPLASTDELPAEFHSEEERIRATYRLGLQRLQSEGNEDPDVQRALRYLAYEDEIERLQIELVKLQRDVQLKQRRVVIIFEGRDAAGKGGAIRRFIEHLNPRTARVVALDKPSERERGQWYFQRYLAHLPDAGEICFFDRSWYNRAVVEPVMGFCTQEQYHHFLRQVPDFERTLIEDGIELIKLWFSIEKDEQGRRFYARETNPLKQWKLSPVDREAQDRWDLYTRYKEAMLRATHTEVSPWIIVLANSKSRARLESMRCVLHTLPYAGKERPTTHLEPDPAVVHAFDEQHLGAR